MTADLTSSAWHTLIAETAHEVARKHGARLYRVEGIAVQRLPHADGYRLLFHFPERGPGPDALCWVDLDGEALACAEEREPKAFASWLAGKIEPRLVAFLAHEIGAGRGWRPSDAER